MGSSGTTEPVPRGVWVLAGSGILPFLTCIGLLYASPELAARAVQAFIAYAALTLSFLGGARWGAELVRVPRAPSLPRLVAAAVPSVVGLAALLPYLTSTQSIVLLMACGIWQLLWDVGASRSRLLPSWNARVRTGMTVAGTVCSIAMLLLKPS
jgi:hypothetical protein